MAKTIKFNMPIDGVKVASLDDLQNHFTTEIIGHFRSGLLTRWLRSRDWAREQAAVEALASDDDATTFKELCRIFKVEADDDAIAAALAEATGVAGIRPDRMLQKETWNPGDTFQDCPECPKLVVVPSGSFMMGSPKNEKGRHADEGPVHEVRIGYQLAVGVYPVTFDEWDACVSGGGCCGYKPDDEGWGRGNRPVINVSWEDAKMYVEWLSWKTGKGYRLLSESEWEYVARAGTVTSYWWGDEIGKNRANCDECGSRWGGEKTSPVDSFSANAFGLHDVHGNVWEWVEDCWNNGYGGSRGSSGSSFLSSVRSLLGDIIDHDEAPMDGSAWKSGPVLLVDSELAVRAGATDVRVGRVLRGGSWNSKPSNLRAANRRMKSTGNRSGKVGFRVARTFTP